MSLVAALTTFGIGGFFLARSPLFNQSGPWASSWENLGSGIILVIWACVLAVFASLLMADEVRHLAWGALVVIGNVMTGIFIMGIAYGSQLQASSYLPSSFTLTEGLTLIALMTSPALGVVGGLLGFFWKRSWKQGAAIPGLAGASRLALVGGVMMFFMILPASSNAPSQLYLLAAFLVLVFSLLVYWGKGDPRVLGISIVAGSLLAGYPFYGGGGDAGVETFPVYQRSPFFLYTRVDPVWTTWAFIGLAGLILATIGGLQTIFWKKEARETGKTG